MTKAEKTLRVYFEQFESDPLVIDKLVKRGMRIVDFNSIDHNDTNFIKRIGFAVLEETTSY